MTVKPDVLAAWREGLEAQIVAPGPLAFSHTLALTVARESPRFEVRSAWGRRERDAWAARVCAGIDAARRATPVTAAEIRVRNGWRVEWEVVVPAAKARPRRAPRTRG